jgi:vacuolar-type H+-ATPase catalytic subunit A/Vma1
MNSGIGKGNTREDHKAVSNQLYAGYAEGRSLRGLVAIVGEEALSERDRRFLKFAEAFEDRFLRQDSYEDRNIAQTLDIAWKLFEELPRAELTRIEDKYLDHYLGKTREAQVQKISSATMEEIKEETERREADFPVKAKSASSNGKNGGKRELPKSKATNSQKNKAKKKGKK